VRDSAIIRSFNDELCWYPAGTTDGARSLASEPQVSQLQAVIAARRNTVVFAVPGDTVRLHEVQYAAAEKRHLRKSLPYTLEEEYASDVEGLHFSMAPLSPETVAVAVCDCQAMENWQQQLAQLVGVTIWVPEALLLPWQSGEWTVVIEAQMALVRTGACTGFSIELELLTTWLASEAESPDTIVLYGQEQGADTARIPEKLQSRLQWRKGDFSTALMLSEDRNFPINMLQGRWAPRLPLKKWWRQWRLALALFATAFSVQVGSSYASYLTLESENLQLRQQIEKTYRDIMPRGKLTDAEKQLQQQLKNLKGASLGIGFVPLLQQVGQAVHRQAGAELASVSFSGRSGDIRVSVVAGDFAAVEAIRADIAAQGLETQLENSNAQGDKVRARLRVRGQ